MIDYLTCQIFDNVGKKPRYCQVIALPCMSFFGLARHLQHPDHASLHQENSWFDSPIPRANSPTATFVGCRRGDARYLAQSQRRIFRPLTWIATD
ncbi:hypothetical protein [Paraburkholderia sabiae]|uniref:Uncharacterized protein n=1 Tax=Paraburkholderia sabiae TaxID=273251 RepID=A0ABU9QRD2_9BURK